MPKNSYRDKAYVERTGLALTSTGQLHPKRQAFVREYLVDLSPRHAAIRAGYAPSTAGDAANALMKMPNVRDHIQRALALRAKRTGINGDRVLDILGRMAMGDPRAVFNEDGTIKAPSELDEFDAMMISGITTRRIVEINPDTGKMHNAEIQQVKLIDRTAVLSLAMRHLGMLNDKITLDVGGSLAEQFEAAKARREGGAVIEGHGAVQADDAPTADERSLLAGEEGGAEEVVDLDFEDVLPEEDFEPAEWAPHRELTQREKDLIG